MSDGGVVVGFPRLVIFSIPELVSLYEGLEIHCMLAGPELLHPAEVAFIFLLKYVVVWIRRTQLPISRFGVSSIIFLSSQAPQMRVLLALAGSGRGKPPGPQG